MSYTSRYERGDWAVLCDACGRKMRASDLRQRWDGLKVCQDDWEPRQPQDFVRGVADYQAPPWTRPEPNNQFVHTEYIYDPDGVLPIQPTEVAGTATLSLIVSIHSNFKTLIAAVTSTVSLIKQKFSAVVTTPTQINGSSINKTTLG